MAWHSRLMAISVGACQDPLILACCVAAREE